MKRDYDLKVRKYQFKKGDIVYMLDQAAVKGKCKKLLPPWKGPCQVIEVLSPYHYRVQYKKRILTVNHDRRKICESNDISITGRTDKQELYCLCRKPDNGEFMIACDACDEWYHGKCVNITAQEGLLIDKYFCPKCKVSSVPDGNLVI